MKKLALIILVGLIPRLWQLPQNLQIHYDQGLHSLAVWNIWHDHKLSLLGHPTDVDGIFHAPIYYWLMVPAYFLGGGDPAAASVFQILLDAFGVVFLFLLARDLFDSKTGYFAALLYSVSYGYAGYARWLSNVTPAFPFSALFFWLLYKVWCGQSRLVPVTLLIASIITEFNGAIGVFLFPVILWVLISRKLLSKINYFWSFILFILPHLPLLAFELRHNFVISKAVLNFNGNSSAGLGFSLSVVERNLQVLYTQLYHLTSYSLPVLTFLLVIASVILVRQKFLVGSIVIFILGLSLYQRGALQFFFVPVFGLFTIIFAQTLTKLPKIIIFIIIAINVYHWKYFLVPHHNLTPIGTANLITNQDRKNVTDFIYQTAAGRPFAVWIYTIPYFLDEPWTYYFTWYGNDRYKYLPIRTGGFSPNDLPANTLFFAIYEPDWNRPPRLSSWQDEVNKNFGPRLASYRSHDAVVEEHAWPN